ncbi:alkyl/aryl-sulfatase [Psychrobacter sp. DAB_AL62B]|uniref:alkyl/aryl-sulfatase n=1 Tax=Psychrobacter sp. DAB_AL62B TaxID=1028420 RepID=UPI002380EDB1|nr:alkyl sulfatase dimerization domain-containing protein [Psychrobacter sp. DAB_AL62B]
MIRTTFTNTSRISILSSSRLLLLCSSMLLMACNSSSALINVSNDSRAPTTATINANRQVASQLNLADQQDFKDARRGLIASPKDLQIPSLADPTKNVWDMKAYDFIQGEAPDTVNPSLWRQSKLNNIQGLFEVTPGIYQLRGFDLSNMTLIKGDSGWIVVDPLTSKETARYAFDFAMEHLAKRYPNTTNISAVLFTHSHIDHFGGVLGIVSQQDIAQKNIPVIAPAGFMEEATSENIIAGNAMLRRATYMFGKDLARDRFGHVDTGLGKGPAFGEFSIATPTQLISGTPTDLKIDGIDFQFQYTPESEAPAEFTFYLPKYKAFGGAELVSRNMHNLYTLRGAKVRDALKWSDYIEEARNLFGDADIYFASHHWPMWGQEQIQTFLKQQRDTYKFIHDQSVRRMNKGMTPGEIAEDMTLPPNLSQVFSNREYYGTIKHNARAVYQNYLGWYDANPAHLDPLPDPQRATAYVKLAGGGEKVLEKAQTAFDNGEYRWNAELLNHLVFAEPNNMAARELLARTYDQLGYQAESGPWRDVYLTGALELREGTPDTSAEMGAMKDLFLQTPVSNFFDTLSVRLKSEEATTVNATIKIHFTDLNESYLLWVENSVLHYRLLNETAPLEQEVQATMNLPHPLFVDLLIGEVGFKDMLSSGAMSIDGSQPSVLKFFSLFENPNPSFGIVLPK